MKIYLHILQYLFLTMVFVMKYILRSGGSMMKQMDLAKKAGLSQGALSNIVSGRRNAHYKTALKLAEILGTSPEVWIIGKAKERKEAFHGSDKHQDKKVVNY